MELIARGELPSRAGSESPWPMTVRLAPSRPSYGPPRVSVSLAEVVARYLGPAPGRVGDRSAREWWPCPFHKDQNPSFCVEPGETRFHCFGCGAHGDAIDFVRRLDPTKSYVTAVASLGGTVGGPPRVATARRGRQPAPLPDGWQEFARAFVEEAESTLLSDAGTKALAYLERRGLSWGAIKAARLGYQAKNEYRAGLFDDKETWLPRGIVIPWFEGTSVVAVNIRRPVLEAKPKYVMMRGSRRRLYPGREVIRVGRPLVIVEGEFEALLLNQALEGLAPAITLGSASDGPEPRVLDAMMVASPWFVAGDADDAGEKSAEGWIGRTRRARRVRTPGEWKDWTEAYQNGVDLRSWWSEFLAGVSSPTPSAWEEASRLRWGPAMGDPTPGIDIPNLHRRDGVLT